MPQQFQLLLPLVLGDLFTPFLLKVAHSSTLYWLSLYVPVQIYSNLTHFCENAPPETKKKRFFFIFTGVFHFFSEKSRLFGSFFGVRVANKTKMRYFF